MTLAAAKIFHELGDALVCRCCGGDRHEIGVMFLALVPCLHCNVSNTWTFHSRWQRIAVSAAGIHVKIILATVCTFLWWYTYPGLLNSRSLNMILVRSLSTILFNGNPLLRYDGDYIFSDLVDQHNMQQRAAPLFHRGLARFYSVIRYPPRVWKTVCDMVGWCFTRSQPGSIAYLSWPESRGWFTGSAKHIGSRS